MKLHRASSMKEWRREVKAKTGGYCKLCGRKGNEAHHIATRHFDFFKLIIENGIFVCSGCHGWIGKNRGKADEIIKSIVGQELWNSLMSRDFKELNIIRKGD